jgi:integrase
VAARLRREKGSGTVYYRERKLANGKTSGIWCMIVSLGYGEDGKRVRRAFYGSTEAEVKRRVKDEQARHGGAIPRVVPGDVKDYLESWLDSIEIPTTRRSYEQRLKAFAYPNIGKYRLADLDALKINRLYRTLEMRGVSADNVQKLHKALRAAFNVAIGQNLITRNPVLHVKRSRHTVAKRKAYTAEEVQRLLTNAADSRYEALIWLGVMAAMRPGELAALAWDDLDLKKGIVHVRHSLRDDRGKLSVVEAKADSARRIPLAPATVAALQRHREAMKKERHRSPYVFVTESGTWLSGKTLNRDVLPAVLKKAKLAPTTLYGLRHTGVSLFAETGAHLRVAADIAGHSTTDLTANVYTHTGEAQHRDAVERISALVLGPRSEIGSTIGSTAADEGKSQNRKGRKKAVK